jgi:OmcA/MtrC family decaheme c-type cytochrome
MTPQERQDSKMAAVLITPVTIPADGRPTVSIKVTERHGYGVIGLSPSVVSWRFALLKLEQGVNGSANDSWLSYMPANITSTPNTETATTAGLTDNRDGTYSYRFTKVITGGPGAAGTTYEPTKVHRFVLLLSASGNPFTPINVVLDFIPATGQDVSGQNDKVEMSSCLQCHTTFQSIAGAAGELGTGFFHGGARFDIHTCAACHNDQRRYQAPAPNGPDSPPIAADGTWSGNLQIVATEAWLNFPVFIHKIHMGQRLTLAGGTYEGYSAPYNVTFPQDVRNCVKCHNTAPLADNYKNAPSMRACGACHDDISFQDPPLPGRHLHKGGVVTSDGSCVLCHVAGGPAGDIPSTHIPVSPPNPNNLYLNPATGNTNTNAATVAAAGAVPPGAGVINYVVKNVATWNDAGTTRPQITFKFQLNGADVVLPNPASATEMIPNFVGGPSAFFSFALPQDGVATPADFNAQGSAYIRNVWNGTGTCSNVPASAGPPVTTPTGAANLTGPDANGFYTMQLKCVVIPANATMLTGGIGYTYALGSLQSNHAIDFINNTQPFTQTNLAAYPYTPNPSGFAGKGGLIVPAIDVSMVATGFKARRSIVNNSTCTTCHQSLGVGPDFHAGQRNDAATCNFCHNPNRTSSAWSANQKDFVHSIHAAAMRSVHFTWQQISPTDGYWQVTYPAVLNFCTQCHLPGTFDFSLASTTAALPNMLASTVGQGTYAPGSNHSPYVTEGTSYGNGFTFNALTGASTQADPITLITTPIMAACSACHDSPSAIDHMQTNGGLFWQPRSLLTSTNPALPSEQCLICHGPGRIVDIALVHSVSSP